MSHGKSHFVNPFSQNHYLYLLNYAENVENESQDPNEMDLRLAKLKCVNKMYVNVLIEQLDEANLLVE